MTLPFSRLKSPRGRVLVLGDVMLDSYVYGDVARISPEAPIPILSTKDNRTMVGGAANVALNAVALGAEVGLLGVIGADSAGSEIRARTDAQTTALLFVDPSRPTTQKTRFIAAGQQILRVDRESTAAVNRQIEDELLTEFHRIFPGCAIIALSDYGKGVLTDRVIRSVIDVCRDTNIPVIVDPKRPNWSVYKGATVIKPNLHELRSATKSVCSSDIDIDTAVYNVARELGTSVLLTRSRDGMSFYQTDHSPLHSRATPHEVFDVSGAGDTALAAFCVSLAADLGYPEAVHLANVAAGIAVTKSGTAIVTATDVSSALAGFPLFREGERVASLERAVALCEDWKGRGLRVGFTNGCFDVLHAGHVSLLAKAAANCDRLIVGLNSDESVQRLKGVSRPVNNLSLRLQVVAALEAPSLVTVFEEDTPFDLIKLLKPDVIFKGADYREEDVVGGDLVKGWGGEVRLIELVPNLSTTNILKRSEA